jgi:hypothetical protein
LIQGIAIMKGVAIREYHSVDVVNSAGSYSRPSIVMGNDDEEVINVISETSFGCHTIVEVLDHLIYLSKTDIEERQGHYSNGLHNAGCDLSTVNYCPSRTEG